MPADNISIMYSAWGAAETRAHPGQVACVPQDNLSCLQTTKPRDNFGIALENWETALRQFALLANNQTPWQVWEHIETAWRQPCLQTTKPLTTLG